MRVVTTCTKEGFDAYGHRVLEGWGRWPKGAELYWYTEGFDLPETPGVVQRKIEHIQPLAAFKARYSAYVPPSYLWDVARYANKVFAAIDGLRDHDGIGVWLDADCVTFKDIPDDLFRRALDRAYLAIYQRPGLYTETGLWVMDCANEQHLAFLEAWASWYESNSFATIPGGWTDCHTLDATIRKFRGQIKVTNLTTDPKDTHPICSSEIGQYIDHCKGPRKTAGISPENAHRNEHAAA